MMNREGIEKVWGRYATPPIGEGGEGRHWLQEGDTFDILREDPYESKDSYIIFHHLHSIDNFIDENENV